MSQTIQVFPRTFAPADTPNVVAVLYTDEEELAGAVAVADFFRLEVEGAVETDLEAEATESATGVLHLVCRLPGLVTALLEPGVYFLRFRVTFSSGSVLTVPPDDRLRLRVS